MRIQPIRGALLAVLLLISSLVSGRQAIAQVPPPRPAPPPLKLVPPLPENLKVFIDCVNVYCDSDFLRTEINFVDHVRDRKDADVHVLVTGESTGGGGTKYTLNFIGLRQFTGIDHLFEYISKSTSTEDELRRGLANTIKIGLIHYVAATPVAPEIQISRPAPKTAATPAATAHDPWDYWFFRTSVRSSINGEQLTNYKYTYGSVSANRVTDAWKINGYASVNYSHDHYTFEDGTSYDSYRRSVDSSGLAVKSLSPRWSAGATVAAGRSTYRNEDLLFKAAPAIEYDIYPYSESTRRQLTFNYALGVTHLNYTEETIYGKMRDTFPTQIGTVLLSLKQPWGSTQTSFEASQYLNSGGKNHLTLWEELDIRLFKGLSFSTYGSIERLRDQVYLAKAGATPEEVLVRQRQLATNYSYYVSFGVTYSFGSIHNNIVNSRFKGF